jgi:hypothetical protein
MLLWLITSSPGIGVTVPSSISLLRRSSSSGIVYEVKPTEIRVVAVPHLRRKSDYWTYRT